MGIEGGPQSHVGEPPSLVALHSQKLQRSSGFARVSPTVVHALLASGAVGCEGAVDPASVVAGCSLPEDALVVVVELLVESLVDEDEQAAIASEPATAPSASALANRAKWGSSFIVRRIRRATAALTPSARR